MMNMVNFLYSKIEIVAARSGNSTQLLGHGNRDTNG